MTCNILVCIWCPVMAEEKLTEEIVILIVELLLASQL